MWTKPHRTISRPNARNCRTVRTISAIAMHDRYGPTASVGGLSQPRSPLRNCSPMNIGEINAGVTADDGWHVIC